MASKIGFKRLTIRILDGSDPTPDTNVFVLEGAENKGATNSAKINGLSTDPVKTNGSDVAYYISRKGVGDVNVDLELLDVPDNILNKILGYKEKGGIAYVGETTEAPYCSIAMESRTADGKIFAYGFFKGTFSMEGDELKTLEGKVEALATEKFKFTAIASDAEETKGQYMSKLAGGDEAKYKTMKQELAIESA